jgi:hypothetical protein
MRRKITAVLLAGAFALSIGSGSAFAAQVHLPGANDAPGSSDCKTNGKNKPPGANGLCKE